MTQQENTSYYKHNKTWFCEEDQSYAISCQETFKISRVIVQVTPEVFSTTEILSASTIKRLVVKVDF